MKLKNGKVQNMEVDAVNKSLLLKRLRDYADATGEMIGKTDIFAKDGPMDNCVDNLNHRFN